MSEFYLICNGNRRTKEILLAAEIVLKKGYIEDRIAFVSSSGFKKVVDAKFKKDAIEAIPTTKEIHGSWALAIVTQRGKDLSLFEKDNIVSFTSIEDDPIDLFKDKNNSIPKHKRISLLGKHFIVDSTDTYGIWLDENMMVITTDSIAIDPFVGDFEDFQYIKFRLRSDLIWELDHKLEPKIVAKKEAKAQVPIKRGPTYSHFCSRCKYVNGDKCKLFGIIVTGLSSCHRRVIV